jgi:putative resolvase
MSSHYVTGKQIQEQYEISKGTLRSWAESGKVECVRMPGGKRLYESAQIDAMFGKKNLLAPPKAKICYVRVSSAQQKADLERQIADLRVKYSDHEFVQDIASGLNFRRKGFSSIVSRVIDRSVEQVVVAHRDRLCRFGFEFIEDVFTQCDTKLVVDAKVDETDPVDARTNETRELADDLLSIVNVFVARKNGLRSAENRRKRKRDESEKAQDPESPS